MKTAETLEARVRGAEIWPLSVAAYHALGEAGLVLGREKQIEVHRQPGEVEFAERTSHGPGGRLTSTAIPSFTVDLSTFFGVV